MDEHGGWMIWMEVDSSGHTIAWMRIEWGGLKRVREQRNQRAVF